MRRLLMLVLLPLAGQMRIVPAFIAALCAGTLHAESGTALSAAGGRYAFGQISDARRDQFMLDTQTGRLWLMTCTQRDSTNNCTSTALQPVLYVDIGGANFSMTPQAPAPAQSSR